MAYVYAGKYIRFDLMTGQHTIGLIKEADVKNYLLGSGYAAKLFYEEMDPSIEPLDPRARLYIFNGLLSGTFAPTGCRSSWCGRSPLTGIWNEANLGGHWGAELRFAGYDGLVISGKALQPSYLYVNGETGAIELRDASHLWGKDTFETFEQLIAETDEKARAAVIGVAGEQLVKIAGVATGGHSHTRLAARGGMGALMGSKNLKAIVTRGKDKPQYFDNKRFHSTVKESNKFIIDHGGALALHLLGTAGGHPTTDKFGDNAIMNWRGGNWTEGTIKTSGQAIADTIFKKHTFCHACPIGCGKAIEIKEGPYQGVRGEGPEYETLCGFGSNLQCDDLDAISAMNDLCNRYGLDTISASCVIAWAFEVFEKGIITLQETGGVALKWGDAEAIIAMIHKIAKREDIGEVLAEGVRYAAHKIGRGTDMYAIHVKGLELPYHDPRGFVSMGANYATASRGGCHLEAISYWRGVGIEWEGWQQGEALEWIEKKRFDSSLGAQQAVDFQNYMTTYNPLGLCKFIIKGTFTPEQTAALVNQALGWNWTGQDVVEMGAKLFNFKRLINVRLGIGAKDDVLPYRLEHEPRPTGSAAGVLPDMKLMIGDYYRIRKWDVNGVPTQEALLPES
jgi:aldehyde:ferredoxin oxidoreductase